jgi:hypothetical protein
MTWQQAIGPILTVGAGLLSWSILRNIRAVDRKIDRVEGDVRTLTSQGAAYGTQLARGEERFKSLEDKLATGDAALLDRVKSLESRERQHERECFERHAAAAGFPAHTPVPRGPG